MRLWRADNEARRLAAKVALGEVGFASLVMVLLAAGAGLLLDFQVTGWHPLFSVGLLLMSVPFAQLWALRRTWTMDRRQPPADYARNLALATVAGQAGCSTVILIFLALFAGMFLDSRLDTHPVFTLGLVLASVPLSLYAMIRLMLSSVGALKLPAPAGAPSSRPAASPEQDSLTTKEDSS